MQLKMKRSQRTAGVISSNAVFCLDARVGFTPAERQSIERYKLGNQLVYSSEASQRHVANADANIGHGVSGNLKAIAGYAMARMRLNISVASLQRGQHIECKSLDELLGAEEAIMEACRNLKVYLDTAATFDGREFLVNFDTDEPQIIAQASSPQPALAAPLPEEAEFTDVHEPALEGPAEYTSVAATPDLGYEMGQKFGRWLDENGIPRPVAYSVIAVFVLILLVMIF